MNGFLRNVNRIEFVVTMACTGKCKHCSEGEHAGCTEHIDKDAAAKAIREICGFNKIESLMTFGGEPLLYPETVACIHETAREMGIAQRDLITNGYFSKDEKKIREVACLLAESGVTRILLSVDAFHQETIPLAPVKYFAACVKEAGIEIALSPAWLVSTEDDNPYNAKTRECLAEFADFGIPVGAGNVIFPSGNALKYLGEYFDSDSTVMNPYEDDPKDVRSISFDPNGDVLGGNVYRNSMAEIICAYKG